MTHVVSIAVAVLFGLSLYGWGRLFCRLVSYRSANAIVTVVIGMAAVIFLGGAANLFHIAFGATLDLMVAAGIALALPSLRSGTKGAAGSTDPLYAVVVCAGVALIGWAAVTIQLPPTAFNYQDDFEKYFAYPVRMLQTGTLAGNPLSALGSETFGGQALLQAMVAHHFPLPYMNGVDAVFALILCLLLPLGIIPRKLSHLPVALLALCLVWVINPQMINISAIYTAGALMMASILILYSLREAEADGKGAFSSMVAFGLVQAALVAIKPIFVLFAALQLFGAAVLACRKGRDTGRLLRLHLVSAAAMALFLMPWFLLFLPTYFHRSNLDAGFPAAFRNLRPYVEHISIFSTQRLFYGSSYAAFTLAAILAGVLGAAYLSSRRGGSVAAELSRTGVAASGMAVTLSYLIIIGLGPLLNGYDANLRYATPVLIGGLPLLGVIALLSLTGRAGRKRMSAAVATVVALELAVIASFAGDAAARVRQGFTYGNSLAFSGFATSQPYLSYNRKVLYGDAKARTERIQRVIPAGEPFVAWVTTPFYFDYRRNRVYDAEQAGIGSPWAYLPDVSYFAIEYDGFAVPPMSTRFADLRFPGKRERYVGRHVLALLIRLEELRRGAKELYNDGHTVVFRRGGV